MCSPEIVLSFNEILFYFTRAAVGAGVPYGLAEDFAKSSIVLAVYGFDPAKITYPALKSIDEGKSSIKIFQTENYNEILFFPLKSNQMSAIQGGASICDYISLFSKNSVIAKKFILKNVDCPLIIAAAIGNNNSGNWKVTWKDQNSKIIYFYIFKNGDIKTSLQVNKIDNKIFPTDVIVEYAENFNINSEILKNLKKNSKNKKKFLEKGISLYCNWEKLYSYFSRILVQSDNNSRISGAGAGLIDVD